MNLFLSRRFIARLLCFFIAAFASAAAFAGHVCGHEFSSRPLKRYEVSDKSHIVVMEYGLYFGIGTDRYPPGGAAVPLLWPYDSGACEVQRQQAEWMITRVGVDAVAIDFSNGLPCMFDPNCAEYPHLQYMMGNVRKLYDFYKEMRVPLRIIPMVGAQGNELFDGANGTPSSFQKALEFFEGQIHGVNGVNPHVEQAVHYQGKPLMMVYVGTPWGRCAEAVPQGESCPAGRWLDWIREASDAIVRAGKQNTFTYRFVTGYADRQKELWQYPNTGIAGLAQIRMQNTGGSTDPNYPISPNIAYPVWSWHDRSSSVHRATYSLDPASLKPENLTLTTAFPGTYCSFNADLTCVIREPRPDSACTKFPCDDYWLADDKVLRGAGTAADPARSPVLDELLAKAQTLQPRFLFISDFNEWGAGDQGANGARMFDIEPTSSVAGGPGWGESYLELVGDRVKLYKASLTRLHDLSARTRIGTGEDILISGFTVAGPGPKQVLIRGFVNAFGADALPDPVLELRSSSGALIHRTASLIQRLPSQSPWFPDAAAVASTGMAPGANEPAILITLDPGNYTVLMFSAAPIPQQPRMGVLDVRELADVNSGVGSDAGHPLSGMSSRGFVDSNNPLIASFEITGANPQSVQISALGPSLQAYGITNWLENPLVQLVRHGPNGNNTVIHTTSDERQLDVTLAPGVYSIVIYTPYTFYNGIAVGQVYAKP